MHHFIEQSLCNGCGDCVPRCPIGAITMDVKAAIDNERCLECGICRRVFHCPLNAIFPEMPE